MQEIARCVDRINTKLNEAGIELKCEYLSHWDPCLEELKQKIVLMFHGDGEQVILDDNPLVAEVNNLSPIVAQYNIFTRKFKFQLSYKVFDKMWKVGLTTDQTMKLTKALSIMVEEVHNNLG